MVMQKSTCTHRSLSPHEQRCGLPIATLNLLDARAGLRRRGGAAADEAEAEGGGEEEEEVVEVEVEVEAGYYIIHGPRAQAEYHHGFEHCI